MLCTNCIKSDVCNIYTVVKQIQAQNIKLDIYGCVYHFGTLCREEDNTANHTDTILKDPKKINELSRKIHELTNDKEKSFKSNQGFDFTVE